MRNRDLLASWCWCDVGCGCGGDCDCDCQSFFFLNFFCFCLLFIVCFGSFCQYYYDKELLRYYFYLVLRTYSTYMQKTRTRKNNKYIRKTDININKHFKKRRADNSTYTTHSKYNTFSLFFYLPHSVSVFIFIFLILWQKKGTDKTTTPRFSHVV
jgi:hypothetical protein